MYTVLGVAELLACESLQVFADLGEGVGNWVLVKFKLGQYRELRAKRLTPR